MTTTEGRLYLIALGSLERLEIQFVPATIDVERNANYPEIAVVGRNTPQYHFTGGNESLPLKLDFFAAEENREDVRKKCQWLKSLTYSDGFKKPPQKVKLVYGDLFKDEEWVVKSVKISYSMFSKPHGFLPQQAYVDIVLGLDPSKNLTWNDIK